MGKFGIKHHERMMRARLSLTHHSDQTAAKGEEMKRMATRFDAIRGAEPTRAVQAFNLFQTPEDIADRMVSIAFSGVEPHAVRWLEPSAGLGRIYRSVRYRYDNDAVLVEENLDCYSELLKETRGDNRTRLVQGDFLKQTRDSLGGTFDVIVMNPPFKTGRDIKHIMHAKSMLEANGRLVSLCYAGVKQRKSFEKHPEFSWEILPEGSFRKEGTKADVAMITYGISFSN